MNLTDRRHRSRSSTRWILAAAVAALPALGFARSAAAQVQQQTTGRALDANNRFGSNGVNTFRPPPSAGIYGNDVVNNNVRYGAGFHGFVPYSDPNEFRGFQAGRVTDNFIKDSTQVGVANTPPPVINSKDVYFAETRFAPPAQPGFVQSKTQPGYLAAQPLIVNPNDTRLSVPLDAQLGGIPRPGEMLLPGPVDALNQQSSVLTASPLTGVRQWNPNDANDLTFLNRFQNTNPLDRVNVSPVDLQRMREELAHGPMTGQGPIKGTTYNTSDLNANGPLNQVPPSRQQPVQPLTALENPNNPNLSHAAMTSAIAANPVTGNLQTEQGFSNRVLGTPQQQSAQYDELKKRLERYQLDRKTTGTDSARAFNDATRKKEADAAKAAAAAKNATDPTNPGKLITKPPMSDKPTPGTSTDIKEPANKQQPTVIKSIGAGMQSKGLEEILNKADALMKDGKYNSAIDQYAAAEAVAPNQPLVWIGRANAELGASYYNRAEGHLKQAFQGDKALLMARYDLRAFLGEERLQAIVKDLKDIASTDQQSATPVFLLAYIAYNTGNERRAAGYIDVAEKRAGGKDQTYELLRKYWSLPTTQETDDKKDAPQQPEINK